MSSWVVPDDLAGHRTDLVLARLAGLSRSRARRAIEEGRVRVDGRPARVRAPVPAGAVVEAELGEEEPPASPDPSVPFVERYVDDAVIVVDKPPGVVVHPGAGVRGSTLVDGLLARHPELGDLGAERRHGLVHRIDRDTSGLLLVARTPAAFDRLQDALRRRAIGRRYLALVHGVVSSATGTIEAPIGADPRNPTRRAVRADGKAAVSHYRRLATWDRPPRTLLEVRLETGRTHQIRVHLDAIGHPIVGDRTYGRGGPGDPGRTFLHAAVLVFSHPATGEEITVAAPLPDDLRSALASLGLPDRGAVPDLEPSE